MRERDTPETTSKVGSRNAVATTPRTSNCYPAANLKPETERNL
jgi:hypothetical protein